jgi:hypothetical protein
MWSGLQESDTDIVGGQQSYRVWWKSQAIGCQGTAVNHTVDVKGWEAWRESFPVGGQTTGSSSGCKTRPWPVLGRPSTAPGRCVRRSGYGAGTSAGMANGSCVMASPSPVRPAPARLTTTTDRACGTARKATAPTPDQGTTISRLQVVPARPIGRSVPPDVDP